MDHIVKIATVALLLFSLGGCSTQRSVEVKDSPSAPGSTTATESNTPSVSLEDEIHTNPREGGVKEYLQNEDGGKYASINAEWKSFMSAKGQVSVKWGEVSEVVFIPVCDTNSGKFILYKNGKNIGDGPCGPGQVNSFSPPRPESAVDEEFTFEIQGANKSEVAVFQERKPN
ncbi:hypothetical protein ACUH93_05830 [Dermabacteraceae bacterium P7006]